MAGAAEIDMHQIMEDIEGICSSAPSRAETLVESYLEHQLGSLSMPERIACLEKLTSSNHPAGEEPVSPGFPSGDALPRLISLLLGRTVSANDLTSQEVTTRLVESFNIIFNNLNKLIESINARLYGDDIGEQTIRQLIGSQIEGTTQQNSLESYIGKIDQAFLTSHKAFSAAAKSIVSQVLEELDPEKIRSAGAGGLKIGVLKKADCFDQFDEKYRVVKKWLQSDRFVDKLLREFEKNCRELSEIQEGSS